MCWRFSCHHLVWQGSSSIPVHRKQEFCQTVNFSWWGPQGQWCTHAMILLNVRLQLKTLSSVSSHPKYLIVPLQFLLPKYTIGLSVDRALLARPTKAPSLHTENFRKKKRRASFTYPITHICIHDHTQATHWVSGSAVRGFLIPEQYRTCHSCNQLTLPKCDIWGALWKTKAHTLAF